MEEPKQNEDVGSSLPVTAIAAAVVGCMVVVI